MAVAALTASFTGCAGRSVQRSGSGGDTEGHGGTGGGGVNGDDPGAGIGHPGGTGAQGGGRGGSAGAGRGGRGSPQHLDGGTSGIAGEAGAGGTLEADFACRCTAPTTSTYDCTTPNTYLPDEFDVPERCDARGMRAKRESCGNGVTRYTFLADDGTTYEFERSADGIPWYVRTSGHAHPEWCGLDPDAFDEGTIRMGSPTTTTCREACALCGDYDDLPTCEEPRAGGTTGSSGAAGEGNAGGSDD